MKRAARREGPVLPLILPLILPLNQALFQSAGSLRRCSRLGLLMAAAMCLLAQPALAQWVWKDAGGRVTASDRPPPRNVPDKDIVSRPQPLTTMRAEPAASAPAAAAPASVLRSPAERELEARKRSADQAQEALDRAGAQKLAEQRAENCRRARSHQSALEGGQRIARTNDKGEREVLDDKGRAEEMRRAREVIASDCSRG